MINQLRTRKLVIAGLMLALGLILPYVTAHGFGIQGNILLPMHIPVLLCGFLCGPMYGSLCGLILPVLNSFITGMPVLFPMAVIMTAELTAYGFVSGILNKVFANTRKKYVPYLILLIAMLCGRIAYGITGAIIFFTGMSAAKFSVIAAIVSGIPGIIIQFLLVPFAAKRLSKLISGTDARHLAINMVATDKATCVTVRKGKIETQGSPRGIAYIIDLYEKGMLENAFVADKIVGKAAAMVFTKGGVASCYAQNISKSGLKWLEEHNIPVEYTNLSENIINRTGDGICPMESTVLNLYDESDAIEALKNKINELKNHK